MKIIALLAIAAGLSLGQISPPPTNAPSGNAGGNLSGTYPNPTVAKINGTTVAVNSTANQVALTTAAAVTAWTGIPSCQDTVGQHLNFNTTTHAFSCGTSGGGTPASPVNSVQFNNAGAFGGAANLLYASGSTTAKATSVLGPTVFTGTGLNDCSLSGTYVGPSSIPFGTMQFVAVIDGTGTPNTLKYSPNGGGFYRATGIPIVAGTPIPLESGISITCTAATGHTLNAQWSSIYSAINPLTVVDAAGNTIFTFGADAGLNVSRTNTTGHVGGGGVAVNLTNTSPDTAGSTLAGVSPFLWNQGGGMQQMIGVSSGVENDGGLVEFMWGLFNNNQTYTSGSVVTDSANIHLETGYGPGGFTTHSGIDIFTPLQADPTGFIGTLYGLRVEDQSTALGVTTNYNIYSEGAGSNNVFDGRVGAGKFGTATNCSSAASPAVCASAAAGSVAIPTGTNPTLVVNTDKVTANSQIFLQSDDTLGTKLSTTCNSTLASLAAGIVVTARTAGTSFTITFNGVLATNPLCLSYAIIN